MNFFQIRGWLFIMYGETPKSPLKSNNWKDGKLNRVLDTSPGKEGCLEFESFYIGDFVNLMSFPLMHPIKFPQVIGDLILLQNKKRHFFWGGKILDSSICTIKHSIWHIIQISRYAKSKGFGP